MGYSVYFKFRFVGRLTNEKREKLREVIKDLSNEDTKFNITRLCRTRLEGSIRKPSYDKINKKPNPRNAFALIKKVKEINEVMETKINISSTRTSQEDKTYSDRYQDAREFYLNYINKQ